MEEIKPGQLMIAKARAKDKSGNPTAIAQFGIAKTFTREERGMVQAFREGLMPFLEAAKAEAMTQDEAQD